MLCGLYWVVMVDRCCLVGCVICSFLRMCLVVMVCGCCGIVCVGWWLRCVNCWCGMGLILIIGLVVFGLWCGCGVL